MSMTAPEITEFTPNPRNLAFGPGWDLVCVTEHHNPSGTPIVWRYQGCEQHCREFVTLSRQVGDTSTFYAYANDPDEPRFCGICYAFKEGRTLKIMWNQVPVEIFHV